METEIPKEIIEKANLIIGEMMAKTVQDEEFRKLALKDFAAAYKQHTGNDLPEGTNMRFVEPGQGMDTEAGIFELPSLSEELSDEDLEQVAGGLITVGGSMAVAAYGVMPPVTVVGDTSGGGGW